MLSEKDSKQIKQRGSDPEEVKHQLEVFKQGFPYMEITKPATPEAGIWQLSDDEIDAKVKAYERSLSHHKVLKFVPASGAASRMFKALTGFLNEFENASLEDQKAALTDHGDVKQFFDSIKKFAFFDDLKQVIHDNGDDLHRLIEAGDYAKVLRYFLKPEGLSYESLPKGLIKFHQYPDHARTSFEEHLVESANYSASGSIAPLHFTVSPEHESMFKAHQHEVQLGYEAGLKVKYEVNFSFQNPSTDTIAVDLNNEPFRDEDGNLFFRPGGHGALLDNLNNRDADIIFIKNIDNVVPDRIKEPTYRYKKLLGGILLEYQDKIFNYLKFMEKGPVTDDDLLEILEFIETKLCIVPPVGFSEWEHLDQVEFCRTKLNRPTRVCGMVKNEGEPGGGPFWAKNSDGTISLQIVEKSQINLDDPGQKRILDQSTHFNPVDIACATKNYKGEKFHLPNYRDPNTGFISHKSKDGRDLKALELPGLWNGAMAYWNTVFVEVPIITFNPVKTILDLLRENHQAQVPQMSG